MPLSPLDEALRIAGRAALRTATLPHTFRRLVTRHDVRTDTYARVAYRIERRRVITQCAPARGIRRNDLGHPPMPASVDPWAVDPLTLPAHSRTACVCLACRGECRVTCGTCQGGARVRCGNCGGSGRVQGQRGPKNCPICRGQQTVKCPSCTRGRVDCFTCDASGAVFAWLEIATEQQLHIHVHPRDGVAGLHPEVATAEDFDRPSGSFRNRLVDDTGWQQAFAVAQPELRPQLQPVADRVIGQRMQRFASSVYDLHYATALGAAIVKVAGSPPGVVPGSGWEPLVRRTAFAGGVGMLAAFAAVFAVGRYAAQSPWFAHAGSGSAILATGLVAAPIAALAMGGWLLPRHVRSPLRTWLPTAFVVAAWACMAVLWRANGPTLAGIEAALERGDLAAAHAEAQAIAAIGSHPDGLDEVTARLATLEDAARQLELAAADDAHLERLREARSPWTAVAIAQEPWHTDRLAGDAGESVRQLGERQIAAALATNDEAALRDIAKALAEFDPVIAERATVRAGIASTRACMAAKDLRCAVQAIDAVAVPKTDAAAEETLAETRAELATALHDAVANADVDATELDARKAALAAAVEHAKLYETLAGKVPPRSIAHLERELAHTERALVAAETKRAAAETKRAAAEQKRAAAERAKERAAERKAVRTSKPSRASSWSSGSEHLMCCDGTRSPSCTVDRASYRGCCSHHGGVC